MGGIFGSPQFVIQEFAKRLGRMKIDTVAVEHNDYEEGGYSVRIAGFGRNERGEKMFYGISVWNLNGNSRPHVEAFTCALRRNSGIKELILEATREYVPHWELPDWLALALHKRSPFELFNVRKRILKNAEITV